jgi:hypothetical protein
MKLFSISKSPRRPAPPEGWYCIETYFGTDSYGWSVKLDPEIIGDFDDPDAAKAAAQTDFEKRVRAAIRLPTPPEGE